MDVKTIPRTIPRTILRTILRTIPRTIPRTIRRTIAHGSKPGKPDLERLKMRKDQRKRAT